MFMRWLKLTILPVVAWCLPQVCRALVRVDWWLASFLADTRIACRCRWDRMRKAWGFGDDAIAGWPGISADPY